jgi:hypothetical protein
MRLLVQYVSLIAAALCCTAIALVAALHDGLKGSRIALQPRMRATSMVLTAGEAPPHVSLWIDMRASPLTAAETMAALYRGMRSLLSEQGQDPDSSLVLTSIKDPIAGLLYAADAGERAAADIAALPDMPAYSYNENRELFNIATGAVVGTIVSPVSPDALAQCARATEAQASVLLFDRVKPSDWARTLPMMELATTMAYAGGKTCAVAVRDKLQAHEAVLASYKSQQEQGSGGFALGGSAAAAVTAEESVFTNGGLILVAEPDPALWECCMMYML